MAEALARTGRPGGNALELLLLGGGKQLLAGLHCMGQAGRAKIVGLADEDGGFEFRVGAKRGDRVKQPPAEQEVLGLDLFLQGNGVGRDDHLPGLIDGVDDPGHEVGETLADAGARLEEEHLVVGHRGGHCAGHLLLLGTMFQPEEVLQPPAFRERLCHQRRGLAGGGRRGAGFIAEADHS